MVRMFRAMGEFRCTTSRENAWDQGCRISFEFFINWLTEGNSISNTHWTPASLLCAGCQANYTVIGHAKHYLQDVKVFYNDHFANFYRNLCELEFCHKPKLWSKIEIASVPIVDQNFPCTNETDLYVGIFSILGPSYWLIGW